MSGLDKICLSRMLWAVREIMGADAEFVRHDESSLEGSKGVLLPGGFSYGDYLRCGAIAPVEPQLLQARGVGERTASTTNVFFF
ncbi:hypothetical protein EfmJHP9_11610 [Enterococcus faecium]|nr:hypothetical protein EfmJHP9_11610 [Enterococcus faecium]